MSEEVSAPPERQRGRRRRRFRRWVVRPLAWSLVLVGLVIVASWALVRSEYMQARLRVLLATSAEEYLGRPIRVGATRFTLLPLSLEAHDVEIGGRSPGDPPFAVIPRLVVEADLFGWRRPILALRRVVAERPLVHVEFYADGTSNVPRPRARGARGGTGGRFRLRIDALSVDGGTLEFGDQRLPLDLEARGVEGDLLGMGGLALQGHAAVELVELTLPRARPVTASVSAHLTIDRGRVDVRDARVEAPAFHGEGEGTVLWGTTRSAEFTYRVDGSTDLLLAMGYLTEPDQAAGTFALDGEYAWRPEGWGYRAAVHSPAATLLGRPVTELEGQLEGDKSAVRFTLDRAAYHGGIATGSLLVDLTDPATRMTTLELDVDGVEAGAALPDQDVPITAIAARASGTFDMRFPFSDPEAADGAGSFTLTPEPARGRRLAVGGTVDLAISGGVLTLAPFEVVADRQRIRGEGSYDLAARRGRFRFVAATERVGDLAVFLDPAPPGEPEPAWVPTLGSGRLEADLTLEPAGPSALVTLDLADAAAPGLRADRAQGTLRVSERWVDEMRLALTRGDATLSVAGRIPLADEAGRLHGEMAVAVESSAWEVDNARTWLPEDLVDWPIAGRFSGSIRLRGSPEDPSGEVVGALNPATLGDASVGALIASLAFDPRRVLLRDLRWDSAAGLATASGTIDLVSERLDLRFSGPRLDLARAPFAAMSGGRLRGNAALEGGLGGTLDRPSLQATLALSDLGARSGAPGPGAVEVVRRLGTDGTGGLVVDWREDRLSVSGAIPGLLDLEGDGSLVWGEEGETARLDLALDLTAPDLAAAAPLVLPAGGPDVSGRVAGSARVHGPIDALAIEATFPEVTILASGHRMTAQEPVTFRLEPWLVAGEAQGSVLSIGSIFLAEEGTPNEMIVAGGARFGPTTRLDLRFQATAAAEWLELVAPALEARGTMSVLAALRGTAEKPELTGQAEVAGARIVIDGFPHAFDDVRAVLLAYPGQIVIDDLRARLAGGTLRGGGSFNLPRGGEEMSYRVQVQAADVALRYPEGWLVRGDGELTLSSLPDGRQLRGFVDLASAVYLRDIDVGLAQLLRNFFARQRLQVAETDEFLATTFLNIAVHAPGAVRVTNNLASLRGSAELTLRGTLASPVVFGTVEADPGGQLVYGDNEYSVTRARLSFANPYRIEPLVDVEARTRVSQYDVRLELVGPLDRLNATFTSDPPIPDLEILSLLATGDPSLGAERPGLGPDAASEAGLLGSASAGAEAFLAGQAANLVGERVNRLFRFDRFRVAPLASGGEGISTVRLTAGKRLSKDLYVLYSVNPSATEDQLLTVEWTVARNLSLVFTQNGNGTYAVDAQWETTF